MCLLTMDDMLTYLSYFKPAFVSAYIVILQFYLLIINWKLRDSVD